MFVTPSVHLLDKQYWWQSNNLCITLGPQQILLTVQGRTLLLGISKGEGTLSPPWGNSRCAAISAFWPGRWTIAIYSQMQTHTFLEIDFPGNTKPEGAVTFCKESSLGLTGVRLSPCGLTTMWHRLECVSVPAMLDKFPIPLHAADTALPETQVQEGFGSYTFYCSSDGKQREFICTLKLSCETWILLILVNYNEQEDAKDVVAIQKPLFFNETCTASPTVIAYVSVLAPNGDLPFSFPGALTAEEVTGRRIMQ